MAQWHNGQSKPDCNPCAAVVCTGSGQRQATAGRDATHHSRRQQPDCVSSFTIGLLLLLLLGPYKWVLKIQVLSVRERTQKVRILFFIRFFTYCITNLIKMIFSYQSRFVSFTWSNLCSLDLPLLCIVLVGRKFVSGKLENYFKKLKTKSLKVT